MGCNLIHVCRMQKACRRLRREEGGGLSVVTGNPWAHMTHTPPHSCASRRRSTLVAVTNSPLLFAPSLRWAHMTHTPPHSCASLRRSTLLLAHTHTFVFVEVLEKVFILPQKVQNISFKKTNDSFTNHNIYNFLMVTFVQKIAPTFQRRPYTYEPYTIRTGPFLWRVGI